MKKETWKFANNKTPFSSVSHSSANFEITGCKADEGMVINNNNNNNKKRQKKGETSTVAIPDTCISN